MNFSPQSNTALHELIGHCHVEYIEHDHGMATLHKAQWMVLTDEFLDFSEAQASSIHSIQTTIQKCNLYADIYSRMRFNIQRGTTICIYLSF